MIYYCNYHGESFPESGYKAHCDAKHDGALIAVSLVNPATGGLVKTVVDTPAEPVIGSRVRIPGRVEFSYRGIPAAIENVTATVVGLGPNGLLFVETGAFGFVKVPGTRPVEVIG